MYVDQSASPVPVHIVEAAGLSDWLAGRPAAHRAWARANRFSAAPAEALLLPDENGALEAVWVGREESAIWTLAGLPGLLPAGDYRLETKLDTKTLRRVLIGWGLGGYRFNRYKTGDSPEARLVVPGDQREAVEALLEATGRVRDWVNTPAEDLGPEELAAEARALAEQYGAECRVVAGDELERNFPAIHAVGRAASRGPRLIVLKWGEADHPPLALVGKGVVFDSGGLNIKPAGGMGLMKKDMGGAAHALALAGLIMRHELPVNLRLYIPAVENAISGNSFRPSDIIHTRNGTTVEIGNTDAEGRMVLSDALTLAGEEGAGRIIDFATLTGAARVALGEDLPPIYGRDDHSVRAIQDLSFAEEDPLWHMPLYKPYKASIQPAIADLSNQGTAKFGGSLTAALFLEHFVPDGIDWFHLDIYAWNLYDRPGRPAGGEAQGLRTIWAWLEQVYGGA